jgi:hypothetical protein
MHVRLLGLAAVGLALCAARASAQHTLDRPIGEALDYTLHSGLVDNTSSGPSIAFSEVVSVPNAAWMRLYFRDTKLMPGSSLRLTSLHDGQVQRLDAAALSMWSETSAYFNGSSVRVELIAGPRTHGNQVAVDHLVIEYGNPVMGQEYCGICGPDDRFPSAEDWSGRILNVGCSGSVFNLSSCVVSAGHCAGGANVIQFRVPPSNPDCSLNQPPVSDQFPITGVVFDNNGLGDDWSVMTTGTNDVGEKPYDRYKSFRRIAAAPAQVGDKANVWGYGIDTECVRSQVQQDSNGGTIDFRGSTLYQFSIDITFGNSGSGLIHNDEVIGIVTHCSDGCPDFATRVDNPDFAAARASLCPGDCTAPTNYGTGTPGSYLAVPHITSRNEPKVGSQSFVIRGENTESGLLGLLAVGFAKASISYGSTTILVDVLGPHLLVPVQTEGLPFPGFGFVEVTAAMPNDLTLDGLEFFSQFLMFDTGAQTGVSATEGLDTVLCCGC